ncbi:MAG: type II toxin-antitoxin system prevent-host-death family antitoxin [Acidobacteriota bacterium]
MNKVNVHEAKTHLSRLVDKASTGEPFVMTRDGKPLAKVTPIDAPAEKRRLGFMVGQVSVPDDFDHMAEDEVSSLFGSGSASTPAEPQS